MFLSLLLLLWHRSFITLCVSTLHSVRLLTRLTITTSPINVVISQRHRRHQVLQQGPPSQLSVLSDNPRWQQLVCIRPAPTWRHHTSLWVIIIPPPGIKQCHDPSICLSVCPSWSRRCLPKPAAPQLPCRPPELCRLRIRPRMDVDPPRSAGGSSSRRAITCYYYDESA